MSERSQELRERTEKFAIAVIKFCGGLANTMAGRRIGGQLLDAATSVAANYRAACRAFTRPLFISKIAIVAEEADESEFWLSLLVKADLAPPPLAAPLIREASELTAIFTASLRTARGLPKNPPQTPSRS
jgi:four helix bundle protein